MAEAADGKYVLVNLGCGLWKLEGAIGIDCDPTVRPDILCDVVANGIPLRDDSVDHLFTSHFLEHLPPDRAYYVLSEIWRVCKPGSSITIIVPSYAHPGAHMFEHPISLSSRAFGEGDSDKGKFLSWFDVTSIRPEYDQLLLDLARRYFPHIPDEHLTKLFPNVVQSLVVECTPKGKGEWTQAGGVREKHWLYYAFGYDLREKTKEGPPCGSSSPEEQATSEAS